ncbi:CIA30 family protein [bacterium]|jgi:hypothetical protein|nr:CIA30 family protein [bacterium]MDC0468617.1 CIA30 family protein [bacterium]
MNYLTEIRKLVKNNLMHLFGLTVVTVISFGPDVSARADTNEIIYSFSSDSYRHWQFVSDGVMGGLSTGKLTFEKDGEVDFGRLTGDVTTKNNGGFIQFRANVSFDKTGDQGQMIKGVRLTGRGNGAKYFIHFRTSDNRRPSDYYSAEFQTGLEWNSIELPFSKFKRSRFDNSILLSGNKIQSMGIVAYGREHIADVSISKIEFYY